MNPETKRHIDAARQVLVGVVPNPTSQIDQITNALIYKFMDDMDQAAIKAGGEPSFFVGDLKNYAWTRLMDSRIGNQDRMNLYGEALVKFSESNQLPQLFRDIFKSAFLPYRSPEVLGLFLKEIDYFDYSHPEDLGDAYEYLLSVMSSQGDAGQFRTPRHIIDFIVDAVNPTKDDKVLDPACGTGGFLVSAYRQILEQHDGKNDPDKKEKPLTPDEKKTLMNNFEGYDIDPGMVRIAQVNMYLHQFKNPKIFQYDSLSMDERWGDKFDVILANPPFMSPKGGVSTHSKFSIKSSRSEVLFVDYIMNHLRPKGRAGIIVPEGIIFQSGGAHKQLRKSLVEDGLYAVVSLPGGVFQPYAGVKTSILLFDNEIAKQRTEMLFVKIENDGFDLGANKRPIDKNDLPEALSILNAWHKGNKIESKKATYVEKQKIVENGDYNLSGDRYGAAIDYTNAKWPMVKIGKIAEFIDDGDWIESKDQSNSGIRLVQTGNIGIGSYRNKSGKERFISDETFSRLKCTEIFPGDVLLSRLPDPVGRACVLPKLGERAITSVDCTIFRFKNSTTARYFIYLTMSNEYQKGINSLLSGATRQRISKGNLLNIEIPLAPIKIQELYVKELDGYQGVITGANQIIQNWKPEIKIDPEWKKVMLGEVCETTSGGTPLKSKPEYYENGDIPWLRSGEVAQGFVKESKLFITKEGLKKSSAKLFPINTVLVAMYGATAGQVGILKFESATNQAVCGVLPNDKFVPEFLFQVLKDQKEKMISLAGGGAQPNISQGIVCGLEVPLPSIKIQKQIVEEIEAERILVESSKKLIEIYEQKTKEAIAKLWSE